MELPYAEPAIDFDPMDLIEAIVDADERFVCARSEDGDLNFSGRSAWGEVSGWFRHREDLPAILFCALIDFAAPAKKFAEAAHLMALVNEVLWLGHFDLNSDDGSLSFRCAVPLVGRSDIAPAEVEAVLIAAIDAIDRFYPSFRALLQDNAPPRMAFEAALLETIGEA